MNLSTILGKGCWRGAFDETQDLHAHGNTFPKHAIGLPHAQSDTRGSYFSQPLFLKGSSDKVQVPSPENGRLLWTIIQQAS